MTRASTQYTQWIMYRLNKPDNIYLTNHPNMASQQAKSIHISITQYMNDLSSTCACLLFTYVRHCTLQAMCVTVYVFYIVMSCM